MALRQNGRPYRYITNRRGWAESRHARYPAWSPAARGRRGMGHEFARVAGPVRHADWRSLWSIEQRGVHWSACHLLAICIDHTKESSSHPITRLYNSMIGGLWGLTVLGGSQTRFIGLTPGKRRASRAAAVIVIRSSAQKSKLIFAGRLQFSMWVDAEDGGESRSLYRWCSTRPVRAAWRGDAAVYWCGTARQVVGNHWQGGGERQGRPSQWPPP